MSAPLGETYNVGGGETASIYDIALKDGLPRQVAWQQQQSLQQAA
jgi:hypothetical protein